MHPRKRISEFSRFSVVGTVGFLADTLVLYLFLYGFGLGFYWGRLISYLSASTTTWYFNRRFTFCESDRGKPHWQWARFIIINGLGGVINYAIYAALVLKVPIVTANPVLGVAAGSIGGLVSNFVASRQLVFRCVSLEQRRD